MEIQFCEVDLEFPARCMSLSTLVGRMQELSTHAVESGAAPGPAAWSIYGDSIYAIYAGADAIHAGTDAIYAGTDEIRKNVIAKSVLGL